MNPSSTQRVLLLTQYLGMGGLERMVLNLAEGLLASGRFKPVVLSYDVEEGMESLAPQFETRGIQVIQWRKEPGFSPRTAWSLARLIRSERFDLVHSHDLGALIYSVGGRWCGAGVPRVHTQHSFVHLARKSRHAWYERIFARQVDALCAVSADTQDQYVKLGLRPSLIRCVQNGVSFDEVPPGGSETRKFLRAQLIQAVRQRDPHAGAQLDRLSERFWVLCLARLHPGKGQNHLISFWRELPADLRARAALVLVGPETFPGYAQGLRERAQQAGIASDIVFTGSTETPSSWHAGSDLFVSASEFEGGPLSPIEASGAGLPLLLSLIPGHRMIEGQTHYFSIDRPMDAVRELALLLKMLVGEAESARLRRWQEAASIRAHFGVQGMVDQYVGIYGSLLRASAKPS